MINQQLGIASIMQNRNFMRNHSIHILSLLQQRSYGLFSQPEYLMVFRTVVVRQVMIEYLQPETAGLSHLWQAETISVTYFTYRKTKGCHNGVIASAVDHPI